MILAASEICRRFQAFPYNECLILVKTLIHKVWLFQMWNDSSAFILKWGFVSSDTTQADGSKKWCVWMLVLEERFTNIYWRIANHQWNMGNTNHGSLRSQTALLSRRIVAVLQGEFSPFFKWSMNLIKQRLYSVADLNPDPALNLFFKIIKT